MNDRFYDQKKEKQDLMINGAVEIIAKNGYKHASTDEMVAVSGVSKGLWFHYFGNKKGLYEFVVHYAVKYALLELDMSINADESDYFAVWKDIAMAYIKLMDKYPYLPLLLVTMYDEKDEMAKELIRDILDGFKEFIVTKLSLASKTFMSRVKDVTTLNNIIMAALKELIREYYTEPIFRKESFLDEFYTELDLLGSLARN